MPLIAIPMLKLVKTCLPFKVNGAEIFCLMRSANSIRVFESSRFVQNNGKFVAAETRDQIAFADHIGQTLGDMQNQMVAHRMSETVIDGLETVEVEKQNGKFKFGFVLAFFERELERFHKKIAVRQIRSERREKRRGENFLSLSRRAWLMRSSVRQCNAEVLQCVFRLVRRVRVRLASALAEVSFISSTYRR